MIDKLNIVHEIGNIIHKDIKPENFRIKDNKLFLIDFGLSNYYDKKIKGFEGTILFASLNALNGK
jgi:serine/threonine protein kinase